MKTSEQIAAGILLVTLPLSFLVVMGIEADAVAWAYWLGAAVVLLQLTAMGLVKTGGPTKSEACAIDDPETDEETMIRGCEACWDQEVRE